MTEDIVEDLMGITTWTPTEKQEKSESKRKCLEEIRERIIFLGRFSVNVSSMSRKYGFEWHTVNRWLKKIRKEIPVEDMETIGKAGVDSMTRASARLERIIYDKDSKNDEVINAIRALCLLYDSLNRHAESHELKDKVADKVDIRAAVVDLTPERIREIVEWRRKKLMEEEDEQTAGTA